MVQAKDKAVSKELEPRLQQFEWFESHAQQPAWVLPLRKTGLARFAELGFPTLRHEDWRFTNVAPIVKLPFRPVFDPSSRSLDRLGETLFSNLPCMRLVFVDGHFNSELSGPFPEQPGLTATSLAAALAGDSTLIEQHLTREGRGENDAFSALNTAFFQDGAFIHVREGRSIEMPIHLLYLSTASEPGATFHPRNLIVAEKGSRLTVLETYVSAATAPYFTNAVTDLVVGEGAVLEHCKFQDESVDGYHIAAIHARLGGGCNLVTHSIATGAQLSRNNIRATLAGEGVECVLNGLYLTRGEQLADHHMVVEHAQPNCQSHEYYNGILDGHSKGVFHGRILVRQAAQKTDAKQTNRNLLLSPDATIDTKPQLEIYADDVKCTHGATVGQLDDESIFYLRARGIGVETARRMLIHAFAGEIIERIRCAPIREVLDTLVWDRLEQNPHVTEAKP